MTPSVLSRACHAWPIAFIEVNQRAREEKRKDGEREGSREGGKEGRKERKKQGRKASRLLFMRHMGWGQRCSQR